MCNIMKNNKLESIERKLDLLLKDRDIMGENGCIHKWEYSSKTDIRSDVTIFECKKCEQTKNNIGTRTRNR